MADEKLALLPITSLLRTRTMHGGICSHARLVCCGFEWKAEWEDVHSSVTPAKTSKNMENELENQTNSIEDQCPSFLQNSSTGIGFSEAAASAEHQQIAVDPVVT